MAKAIIIVLAAICAGVFAQNLNGCQTKLPYKGRECIYFGYLFNNNAQPDELLRSRLYAKNIALPVVSVEDRYQNVSVFAPYKTNYAIYNSLAYSQRQIDPKAIGGSVDAFKESLTEIEIVVKKNSNTTFIVKQFNLTWTTDYKFDVATSKLCIGPNDYQDKNEYYYDCPFAPEVTTPAPVTTTPRPTITTPTPKPEYPAVDNSTIVVNITAVIDIDVPKGTNLVINVIPEINRP